MTVPGPHSETAGTSSLPHPHKGSSRAVPCPLLPTPIMAVLELLTLSCFPSPYFPVPYAHDPSTFPTFCQTLPFDHCNQEPPCPLPSHPTLLAKPQAQIMCLLPLPVPHPGGCLQDSSQSNLPFSPPGCGYPLPAFSPPTDL